MGEKEELFIGSVTVADLPPKQGEVADKNEQYPLGYC
jgi:hypothetical protein